jgi:hypothetical protein
MAKLAHSKGCGVSSRHRPVNGQCPLWVKSRHCAVSCRCPLYPRKQTFDRAFGMSAKCQKQTLPSCFAAWAKRGSGSLLHEHRHRSLPSQSATRRHFQQVRFQGAQNKPISPRFSRVVFVACSQRRPSIARSTMLSAMTVWLRDKMETRG